MFYPQILLDFFTDFHRYDLRKSADKTSLLSYPPKFSSGAVAYGVGHNEGGFFHL